MTLCSTRDACVDVPTSAKFCRGNGGVFELLVGNGRHVDSMCVPTHVLTAYAFILCKVSGTLQFEGDCELNAYMHVHVMRNGGIAVIYSCFNAHSSRVLENIFEPNDGLLLLIGSVPVYCCFSLALNQCVDGRWLMPP